MESSGINLRAPNTREASILSALLFPAFPGRDQLCEQVQVCRVKVVDEDGSLAISVVRSKSPPAPVSSRVPSEGECADSDGVVIHFLLHVVDGYIQELEIYKEDNSKVLRHPEAASIRVFAPS